MNIAWAWIFSGIVGLCIVGRLVGVRAERQAHWAARGAIVQHEQVTPRPIDRLMQRR